MGSPEPSSWPRAAVPHFDADPDGPPANPFSDDVCLSSLGVPAPLSVAGLNGDVLAKISSSLENSPACPLILLTAPRAGYGKTHLLGQVAAVTGQAILVPLTFRIGDPLTLAAVCRRGLEALHQSEGEHPHWTRLREIHAGVVVALMHSLIEDDLVACTNKDQALQVLSGSAIEVFDAEGSAKLIGDWLRKYRNQLLEPLAALAARYIPVRQDLLAAWLEAILDHASDGGVAGLAMMDELAAADAEANIPTWLRLVGLWRQPVLLVDHVDAFHRNPEAGVTIAALLLDLADSHGVHVVLSVNHDIWQATFGQNLPSALEDRLTSSQVLLRGLSAEEAGALVHLRLQAARIGEAEAHEFGEFLAIDRFFLGRPLGSVSARAFLRHAARQWEIFRNSAPPPTLSSSRASQPLGDTSSVPLMTETVDLETASAGLPQIFDTETGAFVREMAAGLSQPNRPAPPTVPESDGVQSEVGGTPPSADAFVKLRDMLGRLRQPSSSSAAAEAEESSQHSVAVAEPPVMRHPGSDALLGRFEALRLQMSAEADSQPLDFTKLAELIRLAGRRFPLVRFSEHELPGMTGRYAMCWSLQGVEILFGLANFRDQSYWRTLLSFAAGRLADLAAEDARHAGAATKLKLVTFKTDREQAGFQVLLDSGIMPEDLRSHLDIVHLDTASVASLYAMQRIIKEAETGALQAEPAQVMSALARELDFFWKRLTRMG